ncbi:lysozyme inhibitor LprI family protein [Brevirhabdus sp.]|uniref:lysozyme inhibitor LprI family protein n=1 Tax=Brevirhabdus sp. TaxID=2004514 RepID=UPI004058D6A8
MSGARRMPGAGAARLLLVVAAIGNAPAAARDLVYSDDATRQCLDRAAQESRADPGRCIGRSADLCMSRTEGGESSYGMSGCLDRELGFWDARLNRTYGKLRARDGHTDRENARLAPQAPPLEQNLRAMQRAWIAYRDAVCDYELATWGGGTGGGPAHVSCMMTMTAKQALYLERWLGE